MQEVHEVYAESGKGLSGDRYHTGTGSYSKGEVGRRQVTLINMRAIEGSGFAPVETRRNIVTNGIELMSLIGKQFTIGGATFFGVKYCEPCKIPSALSGNSGNFMDAFHDRGGIVAEVLQGGIIRLHDSVSPVKK